MSKQPKSFWSELKRRNIFRVATVYLIVGWIIIQIADATFEPLQLPSWSLTLLIVFLVIGLSIALISAWAYEMSPQGMVRTSSQEAIENPYSKRKKKPLTSNLLIAILIVIVAAQFIYFQYFIPETSSKEYLENKSVAVLYFDNLSGDPDQEYFSDGITEEIIAQIAQIEGIRVISRTSVKYYKNEVMNLKKIADELNVSAVLEGSIRISNNRVRVTAQLIDASNDQHIWAEIYDRELKDIFQVQNEIALEIARKFEVKVSPQARLMIKNIPTQNEEAYSLFLEAKHIAFNQLYYIGDHDDFLRAKVKFEQAIRLDSTFADAYAGLADAYDALVNLMGGRFYKTDGYDSTRHALASKAFSLNPNSAFVNNVKAWTTINVQKQTESVLDTGFYYHSRALELGGMDANNYFSLGGFYFIHLGLYDQARSYFQIAADLDPLNPNIYIFMGFMENQLGNWKSRGEYYRKGYDLRGQTSEWNMLYQNILEGNYEEAERLIKKRREEKKGVFYDEAILLAYKGQVDEAKAMVNEHNLRWSVELLALVGMKDEALNTVEQRISVDNSLFKWGHYLSLENHYIWNPYRNDPEFIRVLEKSKKVYDYYLDKYGKLPPNLTEENPSKM